MRTFLAACPALLLLTLLVAPADTPPNPLVDYSGFQKIVDSSAKDHASRRISENDFLAAMNEQGVVLLDARSANMFQLEHIQGAINLPFTDFTADSLAKVLPSKNTKILIYCNNNFLNDPQAFTRKMPPASLNLSTYTSLKAYGYANIYELGPLLDVNKTKIPIVGTGPEEGAQIFSITVHQ